MTDPMTPRTAAGQRLVADALDIDSPLFPDDFGAAVATIEAESVASWLASPEAEEALRTVAETMERQWLDATPPAGHPLIHGIFQRLPRAVLAALRGESDG